MCFDGQCGWGEAVVGAGPRHRLRHVLHPQVRPSRAPCASRHPHAHPTPSSVLWQHGQRERQGPLRPHHRLLAPGTHRPGTVRLLPHPLGGHTIIAKRPFFHALSLCRSALEFIYDARNKFETGKVRLLSAPPNTTPSPSVTRCCLPDLSIYLTDAMHGRRRRSTARGCGPASPSTSRPTSGPGASPSAHSAHRADHADTCHPPPTLPMHAHSSYLAPI